MIPVPKRANNPTRPTLTLESHFGEWKEGVYVTVSNGPYDSALYRISRGIGLGSWQLEHVPEAEGRVRVRKNVHDKQARTNAEDSAATEGQL